MDISRRYFALSLFGSQLLSDEDEPFDDVIPDVEYEEVDNSFVERALEGLDGYDPNTRIQMHDRYRVIPYSEFGKVLREESISDEEWELNWMDCVKYSGLFRFRSNYKFNINCIGTVYSYYGENHVFNVIIFSDGTAKLYEPEMSEFVTDGSGGYYAADGEGYYSLAGDCTVVV